MDRTARRCTCSWSIESFGAALDRVRSDSAYQKVGAEFINAPAANPSYVRVESSLLLALEGIPKIAVPAASKEYKPRLGLGGSWK